MKRNLKVLASNVYDLVILGGGIYGASIAWDAGLRGLKVCLVEKSDFASATSANSLKIIHGGFRYLRHGNLKGMRQLIRERRTWMRIAPHLIHPLPVVIPMYGRWSGTKEIFSAALLVNDLISLDRNRIQDPQKYIPRGKTISRSECLECLPEISTKDLAGGAVFYDAQVYNTERLVLSFLRSADQAGADLANYVEVIRFLREGNRVFSVEVKDVLTDDRFHIRAKAIVNACGPWLDQVLGLVNRIPSASTSHYTKAINLVTRSLFRNCAVGILGANGYRDPDTLIPKSGHFLFVAPWRDRSLIGTRYTPYDGTPEELKVTENDVQVFLDEINLSHPAARLKVEDVTLVHGGLLPIMEARSATGGGELSKGWEILDHRDARIEGFLSVRGAKYTTARLVAEKVVNKVFEAQEHKPPKSLTSLTPIYGGAIDDFENFARDEIGKQARGLSERTVRRLIYNYGSAYPEVLRYLDLSRENAKTTEDATILKAEVIHGVREEMANKLSDVVFRRTDLGTAGHPGIESLRTCADAMAAELGWCAERIRQELEETSRSFHLGGGD
jgi:glycerol-3-phosphate dehydrogenase